MKGLQDESPTIDNISKLGKQTGVYVPKQKNLDNIDKDALRRWRKNVSKARKKGELKHDEEVLIQDISKMVKLFKIYGNDEAVIVNPVENPGILEVRSTQVEKR